MNFLDHLQTTAFITSNASTIPYFDGNTQPIEDHISTPFHSVIETVTQERNLWEQGINSSSTKQINIMIYADLSQNRKYLAGNDFTADVYFI